MIFIILCVWAVLMLVTIWALVTAPAGREDSQGYHPADVVQDGPTDAQAQPVFGAQEAH